MMKIHVIFTKCSLLDIIKYKYLILKIKILSPKYYYLKFKYRYF